MAVEVEDDVFYADLSKQISLLSMDDEEEFPVQYQPLIIGQIRHQQMHHRIWESQLGQDECDNVVHSPGGVGCAYRGRYLRQQNRHDEMAYSINGENYHYGTPTKPCAPDRVPGVSSSGSAIGCCKSC